MFYFVYWTDKRTYRINKENVILENINVFALKTRQAHCFSVCDKTEALYLTPSPRGRPHLDMLAIKPGQKPGNE